MILTSSRDSSSRRKPFERPERSRGLLPLLALQVLFEYGRVGATRPPVTAALLVANTLVYLRPGALHELLPSLANVSFCPYLIIEVTNRPLAYLQATAQTTDRWGIPVS